MLPNSKDKVVPTVFNADKALEEDELSGPAVVWQPKIAGMMDTVPPPPAKRGKCGKQKNKADSGESDSIDSI